MRRSASLTLFLALFAVVTGYLLSNVSFVGKIGIGVFYEQYDFLKDWWKGALLVFAIWIFFYALQSLIQRTTSRNISIVVDIAALLIAVVGLYLSYDDFRRDLSHRWLGERFHIGVYLFWIGWMIISIYLLLTRKNKKALKHKVGMDM
jgi:hypothetical protein